MHLSKFSKYFMLFILFALSLIISYVATAGEQDVKVEIDGRLLVFDVQPVIEKGRTLVPLRAIFEALGAKVNWEPKTKTVTAVKKDTTVKLTIGKKIAFKNNKKITLDVPAKIIKGRTLVPLRFVSEALGAKVNWDAKKYLVSITTTPSEQTIAELPPEMAQEIAMEEVAEKPKEKRITTIGGGGGGGGGSSSGSTKATVTPKTKIEYAKGFRIKYLQDGCKAVIDGEGRKLILVPKGKETPKDLLCQ